MKLTGYFYITITGGAQSNFYQLESNNPIDKSIACTLYIYIHVYVFIGRSPTQQNDTINKKKYDSRYTLAKEIHRKKMQ